MRFPQPQPGLVIRYSYLWEREHKQGRDEGGKDRPCAVLMSIVRTSGRSEIMVLPITHTPPANGGDAIEIPAAIKQRLDLDGERSWIVITEYNQFGWPGPDLHPIPNRKPSTIAYGLLPPRFFSHVRNQFLVRDQRVKSKAVKRTD